MLTLTFCQHKIAIHQKPNKPALATPSLCVLYQSIHTLSYSSVLCIVIIAKNDYELARYIDLNLKCCEKDSKLKCSNWSNMVVLQVSLILFDPASLPLNTPCSNWTRDISILHLG